MHGCDGHKPQWMSLVFLNFTFTEENGESLFQGFEMAPDSGPDHDAVKIDGLAVPPVALSGAHRTEKAVFRENPHRLYSPNVRSRAGSGLLSPLSLSLAAPDEFPTTFTLEISSLDEAWSGSRTGFQPSVTAGFGSLSESPARLVIMSSPNTSISFAR